jgi:hypothetical protein
LHGCSRIFSQINGATSSGTAREATGFRLSCERMHATKRRIPSARTSLGHQGQKLVVPNVDPLNHFRCPLAAPLPAGPESRSCLFVLTVLADIP